MFNFGAAVDVATDDCLFMAGPSRTSEATAKVFVPSVRSPTRQTKNDQNTVRSSTFCTRGKFWVSSEIPPQNK